MLSAVTGKISLHLTAITHQLDLYRGSSTRTMSAAFTDRLASAARYCAIRHPRPGHRHRRQDHHGYRRAPACAATANGHSPGKVMRTLHCGMSWRKGVEDAGVKSTERACRCRCAARGVQECHCARRFSAWNALSRAPVGRGQLWASSPGRHIFAGSVLLVTGTDRARRVAGPGLRGSARRHLRPDSRSRCRMTTAKTLVGAASGRRCAGEMITDRPAALNTCTAIATSPPPGTARGTEPVGNGAGETYFSGGTPGLVSEICSR